MATSIRYLGLHNKITEHLSLRGPLELAVQRLLHPPTTYFFIFLADKEIETQTNGGIAQSIRRPGTRPPVSWFQSKALPRVAYCTLPFQCSMFNVSLNQPRGKMQSGILCLQVKLPRGAIVCFINEATEPCSAGEKGDIFPWSHKANIKHRSVQANTGKRYLPP